MIFVLKQKQALVSSLFLSLGAFNKLLLPGHFGRAFFSRLLIIMSARLRVVYRNGSAEYSLQEVLLALESTNVQLRTFLGSS